MDNFKLNYSGILFFTIVMIFIVQSCKNHRSTVQSINIDRWNKSTQDHIKLKCDSEDVLQRRLIPEFALSDSMVFSNLNQYIQHRLNFRKIVIDSINRNTDLRNVDKIRIEEFYNDSNSKATVYLENRLSNSRRILRIALRDNIVEVSEVSDLSKYSIDSYDDDCLLAMKSSMVTRFTIITDFIGSGKSDVKFISLY